MRRNCKSITTSPEIVKHIDGLTETNFNLLVKLVPWLDANEKAQRRFRYAVIGKLSRIEAAISLILVGQMAQTPRNRPFYNKEDLEKDAKMAEDFIARQAVDVGQTIVKYIYTETKESGTDGAHRDRRRKWHGWEI